MNIALLKKFKPNNVFESLRILKYITIFNGLLPFYLCKDGKTVRFSKILIITCIAHYMLFIICFTWTLQEGHRINETFFKSNVSYFLSITLRISSCGGMTFLVIPFIFLRRQYLRMIQLLVDLDEIFRNISIKVTYQDITNFTLYVTSSLLVFKIIYNVSCMALFGTDSNASFTIQIAYNLPSVFKWIYVLVFIVLVHTIKIYLKGINQVRFLDWASSWLHVSIFIHKGSRELDYNSLQE